MRVAVVAVCVGCGFAPSAAVDAPIVDATDAPVDVAVSDVIARWDFDRDLDPMLVRDTSGVEPALDLRIEAGTVTWLQGGLRVEDTALIKSQAAATKLHAASLRSPAFTVEMWVKPEVHNQAGPARVFTYSLDGDTRNFTIAQEQRTWVLRVRTSNTPDPDGVNGQPNVTSGSVIQDPPLLTHVAGVHDGTRRILYVDGRIAASDALGGSLAPWDAAYAVGVANELVGDNSRDWRGELYRVTVYGRALSDEEIAQLHAEAP